MAWYTVGPADNTAMDLPATLKVRCLGLSIERLVADSSRRAARDTDTKLLES